MYPGLGDEEEDEGEDAYEALRVGGAKNISSYQINA